MGSPLTHGKYSQPPTNSMINSVRLNNGVAPQAQHLATNSMINSMTNSMKLTNEVAPQAQRHGQRGQNQHKPIHTTGAYYISLGIACKQGWGSFEPISGHRQKPQQQLHQVKESGDWSLLLSVYRLFCLAWVSPSLGPRARMPPHALPGPTCLPARPPDSVWINSLACP